MTDADRIYAWACSLAPSRARNKILSLIVRRRRQRGCFYCCERVQPGAMDTHLTVFCPNAPDECMAVRREMHVAATLHRLNETEVN